MENFVSMAQNQLATFVRAITNIKQKLISLQKRENGALDASFCDSNNNTSQWRFNDECAIQFLPSQAFDKVYYSEWQQFIIENVLNTDLIDCYLQKVKNLTTRHFQEAEKFIKAVGQPTTGKLV